MKKVNIEIPLREVRRWKSEISRQTKGMNSGEVVKYFREGAEEIWKQYGYKCVPINNVACQHIR